METYSGNKGKGVNRVFLVKINKKTVDLQRPESFWLFNKYHIGFLMNLMAMSLNVIVTAFILGMNWFEKITHIPTRILLFAILGGLQNLVPLRTNKCEGVKQNFSILRCLVFDIRYLEITCNRRNHLLFSIFNFGNFQTQITARIGCIR